MAPAAVLEAADKSGAGSSIASSESLDEVSVLVTGYGPFLDKYPVNSSWSIASRLPSALPPTPYSPSRIRITVRPDPIHVSWTAVEAVIAELYSHDAPHYDVVLHIGLAAARSYYTLERLAYRGKFDTLKDVEGKKFPREDEERLWGSGPEKQEIPMVLRPTMDCDDVWRRWRGALKDSDMDVRPSDDPGNYLCGFIYYSSMAELWRQDQKRRNEGKELEPQRETRVMFLHVPDLPMRRDIEDGVEIAVALIRALVESRRRDLIGEKKGEAEAGELCNEEIELGEYPETWAQEREMNIVSGS